MLITREKIIVYDNLVYKNNNMKFVLVLIFIILNIHCYSIEPYGINNWYWDNPYINKLFKQAKMKIMRVMVYWPDYEPEENKYNWEAIDITLDSFLKYDFKANLAIYGSPEWARTVPNKVMSYSPDKFAKFVKALLRHCESVAPGYVISVEWNEDPTMAWVNNQPPVFGTDQRDPSLYYAEILKATYQAVKSINPNILVVMDSIWQQAFHHLDELYQLGLKDYFDRINYHYYTEIRKGVELPPTTETVYNFDTSLKYLKYIADKWGDTDKKIWVTEFGWRHSGEKNKSEWLTYVMDVCRKSGYVELVQPYVGSWQEIRWNRMDTISLIYQTWGGFIKPTTAYYSYCSYTDKYSVWNSSDIGTLNPLPPATKDIELINSGFELGNKRGWQGKFSLDSEIKYAGLYSGRVKNDNFISSNFYPVEPGKLYEVTSKIKIESKDSDSAMVTIQIGYITSEGEIWNSPPNYYGIVNTEKYPGGWRCICFPEYTPKDAKEIAIKFILDGKGTFWIDDVAITALDFNISVPVLKVDMKDIDFGVLKGDESRTVQFKIINTGEGKLRGKLTSTNEWLKLEPTSFESNEITVNATVYNQLFSQLRNNISSTTATNDTHYGKIEIITNGGNSSVNVKITTIK